MRTLNVWSISMPAIRLRWEHHLHPFPALTCIFTVLKKIPSSNVETRQNSLVPNRKLPKRKLHQQQVAAFYTARFLEPVMGSQAMQRKMISKSLMDLGAMDCLEKMGGFLAVICLKNMMEETLHPFDLEKILYTCIHIRHLLFWQGFHFGAGFLPLRIPRTVHGGF